MIPRKFSGLSILLILALLISSFAAIIPATPVAAACAGVSITSPTSGAKYYVKQGGTVPVISAITGTETGQTMYVQITNGTTDIANWSYTVDLPYTGTQNALISGSAPAGTYNVIVTCGSFSATSTGSVVVDNTAPTVSIIQPNSSTGWNPTVDNTLTFSTSETANCWAFLTTVGNFATENIDLHMDGESILGAKNFTVLDGYILDTVNSTNSQIQIIAVDNAGNRTVQLSSFFAIVTTAPTCTVLTPGALTDEIYNQAATTTISGTINSSAGAYAYYQLGLFDENVGLDVDDYVELIAGWTSITLSGSAASISKSWKVTSAYRGSNMRIGIRGKDIVGNVGAWAFSPYIFRIKDVTKPTVTHLFPKSGNILYQGGTENITWSMTDNAEGDLSYYIWLSIDGGTTFPYLMSAGTGEQGTNAIDPWLVPAVDSTKCMIQEVVSDSEDPQNTTTVKSSNFTIKAPGNPPTVTLTNPAGGESYTVGTSQTIKWTSADSSNTSANLAIDIWFSANNGTDWVQILNGQLFKQGAQTWDWTVTNPVDLNGAWPDLAVDEKCTTSKIKITATNEGSNLTSAEVVSPKYTIVGSEFTYLTKTVHLDQGWNLISLPLVPTNTAIATVLADALTDIDAVWTCAGGTTGGTWSFYTPGSTSGLKTMVDGKGYWIKSKTGVDFSFQGMMSNPPPASPPSYSTVVGWNLIGYKSTVSTHDVEEYLGPQTSGGTRIYNTPLLGYVGGAYQSYYVDTTMPTEHGFWVYYNVAGSIAPPTD